MSLSTGNLIRLLSMGAVFVIHASSFWEAGFAARHEYLSQGFGAVVLSQLGRFCVPVFVILSGYGLMHRYPPTPARPFEALNFLKSRASKILLPYLVLSLLFLIVRGVFSGPLGDIAGKLVRALALGSADYHFYFFPIILQCYLLFPLLRRWDSPWTLIVTAVIQFIWAYPVPSLLASAGQAADLPLTLPAPHAAAVIFWVFFFHLGIICARHEDRIVETLAGLRAQGAMVVATILGGGLVLADYIYRSHQGMPDPGYYNHFNRLSVTAYSVLIWFLFMALARPLKDPLEKPAVAAFVGLAAGLSFAGYIWHVWVLRALAWTPVGQVHLLLTLLLLLGTGALVYAAHLAIKKPKLLRQIIGLP